jgi:predicted ribosome quality control (RQC) complex YloA/Tae2 family protein
MSSLDTALDELYALPLDEFTSARNALATRLKKEGDKKGAEQVKKLGKPTVSAWVVNQLHRERSAELEALIEAGDAMRSAQRSALRGEGGDELREASRAQREALSKLMRSSAQILEAAGHAASDATLDRVGVSLQALSAAGWGESQPGRLERDIEPPGFDALAGLLAGTPANAQRPAAPTKKKPERARVEPRGGDTEVEVSYEEGVDDKAEQRAAEQRAREQRAEAEALIEQAKKRARKLEREAEDAEQARARAEERARALREEAQEAARRAREVQERADAAADKTRAAAAEAKDAARSAAEATREVEAAEKALRKL